MLSFVLPCFLGADELFAAPTRHLDPSGICATQFGQRELVRAQGDAPNSTVYAGALVFAVRAEGFTVLVDLAVVLAGSSI